MSKSVIYWVAACFFVAASATVQNAHAASGAPKPKLVSGPAKGPGSVIAQPNVIGCDGSDEGPGCMVPEVPPTVERLTDSWQFQFISGGYSAVPITLETVYTSGFRSCSIEINGVNVGLPDCTIASALGQLSWLNQVTGPSLIELDLKVFSFVFRRIPVSACGMTHPIPQRNQEAHNFTSRDGKEFRGRAADAIIRGTGQTVNAHGRKFSVTYSDGGSETITFNYFGSNQIPTDADLVLGNGVSQCPVS